MPPIYHHIALPVPLPTLFTYAHPTAVAAGCRVAVRFRGKLTAGIVWAANIKPDIAAEKILPIETVFTDEPPLPDAWLALLTFSARYYHYPLGQAVAAALPTGMREPKPLRLPETPPHWTLSPVGQAQAAPPAAHKNKYALWQALASGSLTPQQARRLHPQANTLLTQWQAQGWLSQTATPAVTPQHNTSAHELNPAQTAAAEAIEATLGRFSPFLLHGITGSGKTEVYFSAISTVLARGQQVLFLLPEINLTPQLLARVRARFADVATAVLHSQAASGARTQDYLRALTGQVSLIIGTRLAVFTPLPNLGLIVVDEEHDASFKQDNDLRYHARDLAVWRAQQAACPIVLGSATPSLESWHKAQQHSYQLLRLPERAHQAARLPEIRLDDVRRQKLEHGFAPTALKLLQKNHAAGGLSMVYLNRRGFAPALFCSECGHTFGCPRCSAKMVLHQRQGQLRCHHCDFRQPVARQCPACGNQDLTAVGHGTQRVEEHLRALLPQARITRVDRDSISRKHDWDDVYAQISAGETDILVGTQMLAKGHDFARLNLVIVLNADGSLYSSDFRAPERLFAELMQVAGRAGRADAPGQVWVQTQLPEHAVFQALLAQDYPAFADAELAQRQVYGFSPFGHSAAIRADAPDLAQAMRFLNQCKQLLASTPAFRQPETDVSALGPAPMLMMRLAERERAQVFLESPQRRTLHQALQQWQTALAQLAASERHIRWSIDVDPQDM